MNRPGSFWSRLGLRGKILLSGGLPIVVVLALITAVILWHLRQELVRSSLERIEAELGRVAAEVDRANAECLTVAATLSEAQEAGLFGDRPRSVELARRVLVENPQFTGVYFGYEPDADGQDAFGHRQGELPPGAVDANGRFLPYWVRDRGDPSRIGLEPLVNMETSYYYQGARNRSTGRPESSGIDPEQRSANSARWTADDERDLGRQPVRAQITEPYLYEGALIIEQTAPILIDDRFVGIAGVDRTLEDLERFVFALRPFDTARITLVSRRGRVVASTRDRDPDRSSTTARRGGAIKSLRIEDTPIATVLVEAYEDDGDLAPHAFVDPERGVATYAASAKVANGGWTVVMSVDRAEILAPIRPVLAQALALCVPGIGLVLLVLWLLARQVAERIGRAGDAVRRVAEGDLTVRVEAEGDDEAGRLLGDLAGMVRDLGALVGAVRGSSAELGTVAESITAATIQQEGAVQGAAGSIAQTAAAVREISATARELNHTMEDVAGAVQATAEEAGCGRERLAAIESAIRGLASSGGAITGRFDEIRQNSEAIRTVVTTIAKIAQQTNILSLNASIQAEKAGESGLGFAAVAREIRQLADRTETATDDIRRIVEQMQASVASGASTVRDFGASIGHEVRATIEIGAQFGSILEQVEALTPRFDSLRDSMHSQSEAAGQISDAMSDLTRIARQAADAIAEFHAASRRLGASVDGLRRHVQRFRVQGDGGGAP